MSEPLSLIYCEQCRATGRVSDKQCPACDGRAVGFFMRGIFAFWKYPLDGYHIVERRFKIKFDIAVNIALLIIALGLCALYFFQLFENLLPVACASAVMLLLIMRFIRNAPHFSEVPQHNYLDTEETQQAVLSWAEIRRLKSTQVQNISETYTHEALLVLERAYSIAASHQSPQILNTHLFAALLENEQVQTICIRLLVPPKEIEKRTAALFNDGGVQSIPYVGEQMWQLIFSAYKLAWQLREPHVDVTELLQTVIAAEEPIRDMLFDVDIKPEALNNVIEWVRVRARIRRQTTRRVRGSRGRSKGDTNRAMTAVATPFLNSFSEDLTKMSLYGQLEQMVGREREIESIFRILQGGGMSVLLVGEHGVGKRTLVHGIAELMVAENVPDILKDKRLVELNLSRMLSGVNPSEAEERLLTMLTELEQSGNIILVIPSIEKIVGITIGQQQSMDVASVLTQELGKRSFLTIATTTPDAFNRVISNQALGTVFQKIEIDEMDANASIQVLEAKAGYVEYRHEVWFSYPAIERAVSMSQRYMHDAYLPTKAIQVCNEVALYARNKRGKNALVMPEDVSTLIAEKTKIPVTAVSEDESAKLMRLESELHHRVIGQEEAVTLVANALRRARAELRTGKRPIANFLFLGPTGVGKTELTKTIAEVYFGSEQQMIRMDMSEYQDTNSIYRLIGRPGEQGTGMLTEAVRQKPFSLVLLDELEKADPNILNLFLQVMDDGRLTDSVGRVIDFTNTILIATSNAGTQFVQEQMRAGQTSDQIKNQLIHGELKAHFRPEFLNRFDAIVLFQPLTQDQIGQVARLILGGIGKKLEERGIFLEVTDAGVAALAAAGFDPEFGARPLRRVIQDRVENSIAGLLLQNQVHRKDTVVIDETGVHVRTL